MEDKDKLEKNKTFFFISCIFDYADRNNISYNEAYSILKKNNCINYLIENYDIEHTLSKDDTLEALSNIIEKNSSN